MKQSTASPLRQQPQGLSRMDALAQRIGSLVRGLPSAARSVLRRPAPAGHTCSGPMTSSAWEGWWHEEPAPGPRTGP